MTCQLCDWVNSHSLFDLLLVVGLLLAFVGLVTQAR